MWIRHQVEGSVRWHGSIMQDACHPVTGEPLRVSLNFDAHFDENGKVTHWTGKIGKDEFVVYND